MVLTEIQKRVDNFFKEYGKNKPKTANNRCAKRKKSVLIRNQVSAGTGV